VLKGFYKAVTICEEKKEGEEQMLKQEALRHYGLTKGKEAHPTTDEGRDVCFACKGCEWERKRKGWSSAVKQEWKITFWGGGWGGGGVGGDDRQHRPKEKSVSRGPKA